MKSFKGFVKTLNEKAEDDTWRRDYYNKMYNSVYKSAKEKGVKNPEVIARLGAAQTSLETGFGKSMVGNNAFGVKSHGKQGTAGTVDAMTGEHGIGRIKQTFRAYKNVEDSAGDYVDFLQQNKRYAGVLNADKVEDALALQGKSGYATDPNYGSGITNIHNQYNKFGVLPPDNDKQDGTKVADDKPKTGTQPKPVQVASNETPKVKTDVPTVSSSEPKIEPTTHNYSDGGRTTETSSAKLYQSPEVVKQEKEKKQSQ